MTKASQKVCGSESAECKLTLISLECTLKNVAWFKAGYDLTLTQALQVHISLPAANTK